MHEHSSYGESTGSQPFAHWTAACAILAATSLSVSAQAKREISALMVLRDQLGSLAREVVASIPIAPPADVLVSVEGGRFKTLEENALIGVLTAHGLRPYLSDRGNTQYARLQVAILEQTIAYHGLSDGTFERRIRQTLEARFDKAPGEQVTLVGNFTRESVDSVASQEKWLNDLSSDEPGFMDHVFGPLVVISASVVIIYFLFTVRS